MNVIEVLGIVSKYIGYAVVVWILLSGIIGGFIAAYYESKLWRAKGVESMSAWGFSKVFLFNIIGFICSCISSVIATLVYIGTIGNMEIVSKLCNTYLEVWIGSSSVRCMVGHVEIINKDKLPKVGIVPAPVYIANHSSQIDSALAYYLGRRFKWISKTSVLWLPGVGQMMYYGDHILIRTTGKGRGSMVKMLYEKSDLSIQNGMPMVVYPQGTRKFANPPLPFKDGAFNISVKNKTQSVPMTLYTPHSNPWNSLYPLTLLWGGHVPTITITIHDPIQVTGTEDVNELKQKCMDIIYSPIPKLPASTVADGSIKKDK